MRRQIVVAAVLLVLAGGAYGGFYWWTVLRFEESTDDAYVASDASVISPKVEGYIKEVRVRENQHVDKGAVLFVIDDSDFAARAAQAEAAAATEAAAVETFRSRLEFQQAMIGQAQAELAYKRYGSLMTTDFASRQRYEQAVAEARKTAAAVVKSRAALAAAQSQLGVLKSQEREEKARRQQARASVVLAQNDLGNTVIRAPVAGVA